MGDLEGSTAGLLISVVRGIVLWGYNGYDGSMYVRVIEGYVRVRIHSTLLNVSHENAAKPDPEG